MEVEQLEIREFLRRHPPFSFLDDERLDGVSGEIEIAYYRAGSTIVEAGQSVDALHLIRKGCVETLRRSGEFHNRLDEGDLFGQLSLMSGRPARFSARALEDSLIYFLPEPAFRTLVDEVEPFAEFIEIEDRARLRQVSARSRAGNDMMTTRVARLVDRKPVMIAASASVQAAAALMTEQAVSSVIVLADLGATADPGNSGDMVGIVTDGDLRRRVLAEGLSSDLPVGEVMSEAPVTVERDDFLFEALLAMLRHNVHHLPVLDRQKPCGVIDLSDVVGYETRNSLFVVQTIAEQNDLDGLRRVLPDVRGCFLRMVDEAATSNMIGAAMSTIGRTFKQRLLELAEAQLGPPPVPYCFLALGSMARDEQSLVTDQDNALVLSDDFDPARHDDYFARLARFVCDGLNALGYPYCKGKIMATYPDLRQPLAVWQQRFERWIGKPDPQALLNSSIFFDLAGVHGQTSLAGQLTTLAAQRASQSKPFLGCLAHNAQTRKPPLGFFRDFVLEAGGRHGDSINLKRRGTAPLVDVIRTHALASASTAQNSFRRLTDIQAAGFLTSSMAADLRDSLEFIATVQFRHQAFNIQRNQPPDNNIDPEILDTFDRRNLKDAFKVLSNAQKFLKMRYRLLPT